MSLIYQSLQRLEEKGSISHGDSGPQPGVKKGMSGRVWKKGLLPGVLLLLVLLVSAGVWFGGSLFSWQEEAEEAVTAAAATERQRTEAQSSSKNERREKDRADPQQTAEGQQVGAASTAASGKAAGDAPAAGGVEMGAAPSEEKGQPARQLGGDGSFGKGPELVRANLRRDGRRMRLSLEFTSRPEYTVFREMGAETLTVAFQGPVLQQKDLFGLFEEAGPGGLDASISHEGRRLQLRLPALDSYRDFILPGGSDFGPRLVVDLLRPSPSAGASSSASRAEYAAESANPADESPGTEAAGASDPEAGADGRNPQNTAGISGDLPQRQVPQPQKAADRSSPASTRSEQPQRGTSRLETSVSGSKSAKELAEESFKAARQAMSRGSWSQAEALLQQVLSHAPDHLRATRGLASIFIRTGRKDSAERVLRQGLMQNPDALALRTLLAGLFIEERSWDQALQVLTGGKQPSIAERPRHFARLASVYRHKGEYAEAAAIYATLSQVEPKNGKWRLGLGLSREGQGREAPAAEAYRAALDCPSLSPRLRGFVDERLKALGEKRGME